MPVECVCKYCGSTFALPDAIARYRQRNGHAKYCSKRCGGKANAHNLQRKPRPQYRCAHCGSMFTSGRLKGRTYCSGACASEAMVALRKPRIPCACQSCGKEFEIRGFEAQRKDVTRRRGKYCSASCAGKMSARRAHQATRGRATTWSNAMLRRFMEWKDKGCAFPLCESAKGKSRWNLCSLHAQRLNKALKRRRSQQRQFLKENQ